MEEHTTHNRVVGGSNPPAATRLNPDLAGNLGQVTGARVLVAVSGGPDSTALLVWLVHHAAEIGAQVGAAHFDHALRPASADDAAHVGRLCAALKVPLIAERRRAPLASGSLQAAARRARLEFLEGARTHSASDVIALGHTADDVVEGALLHLLRGSGLAGMRGMPAERTPFVRPLLGVWREEIEEYLRALRSVTPAVPMPLRDPSNADTKRFARARIRHHLLPRLEHDRPDLKRRLWAAAQAAGLMQQRLEGSAAPLIAQNGSIDRRLLKQEPAAVRREALRQLYGRRAGLPGLSRVHLLTMEALAMGDRTGRSHDLPNGLRFQVDRWSVSIGVQPAAAGEQREPIAPEPLPRLITRPCGGACQDRDGVHLKAGAQLTVGRRTPGLRLRPLGGRGSRKLQDLLVDAGVPRRLRDDLPLVFADGRLAWVPGVAVDTAAVALPGERGIHVSLEGVSKGVRGAVLRSATPPPRRPTA